MAPTWDEIKCGCQDGSFQSLRMFRDTGPEGLGCLEYVLVDPWVPDPQLLLGVVGAGPFGVGTQPGRFRTSQSPGSTSVPTHEALLSLVTEEPCDLPRAHPAGPFQHQGGQHPSPNPSPWLSKGFWVIVSISSSPGETHAMESSAPSFPELLQDGHVSPQVAEPRVGAIGIQE